MFSRSLQLVCFLVLSMISVVRGQATSTGISNGIVSAAGGPVASQTVAYSIEGEGVVTATPLPSSTSVYSSSHTTGISTTDNAVTNGSMLTTSSDHGLTLPAILGIVVAVVLAVVGITIAAIFVHRKNQLAISQAQRKTIMDAEFAASEPNLCRTRTEMSSFEKTQIGYFDVAKPLPAVLPQKPIEDDRLSRSSTIIADAAEVAQINRKMSTHQIRAKKSREQVRERNHALQILITNADNRTSLLHSPLSSNPATPVDSDTDTESPSKPHCPDGDGDAFTHRVSKL